MDVNSLQNSYYQNKIDYKFINDSILGLAYGLLLSEHKHQKRVVSICVNYAVLSPFSLKICSETDCF